MTPLSTYIDTCYEHTLDIEICPVRPDLLSGETLAKAIRPFLHGAKSEPSLDVNTGSIQMRVDPALEHIRPIILGAVVRNVKTGSTEEEKDEFIKALMEHQEKLHFALGRGRRRASIGVHDLAKIAPPFHVQACTSSTSFCPLPMN